MKKYLSSILTAIMLICGLIIFQSCGQEPEIDITEADLIPFPQRIETTNSIFEITKDTRINIIGDAEKLQPTIEKLNAIIKKYKGFELSSAERGGASRGINIVLTENENNSLEQYDIDISSKQMTISASGEAGLYYGLQTLEQLLPAKPDLGEDEGLYVGTGTIRDYPAYEFRGAMLDVARHFFPVETVKKYIDHIATYKMNHLHLHLSDDQGWRIEIKSWPKLTEIGGSTEVGGGPGGFYTQEQYTEIVNYAASKFITVIPEIDMPGHTNAALASYPELNCNNKATELYTGIEVGFSTLCTDKEIVYQFADDVIRELAEITPGKYIHIGGDETHATKQEDYIPFMNRVQDIVKKHGKDVMAWDEIAHATPVDSSVVVQFWASEENSTMAKSKGAKVLISPAKRTYLDMQYDSTSRIGLHWAAYIEVDDSYTWDPTDYVEGLNRADIIGVETPLWSETVENNDDIEYLLFPRLTAISEVSWTLKKNRDWEKYAERLAKHSARFEAKGINYYRSPRINWKLNENF